MTGADLAPVVTGLLNVQTGELLPATVANAARVLGAARTMKQNVNDVVAETTAFLVAEAEREGTKTLHDGSETITITGGQATDYDAADLMEALRAAGCPEHRIGQAVVAEITYKVDRAVLRQLAAANPTYKAAIATAERVIEKPYRASVKLRRQKDD